MLLLRLPGVLDFPGGRLGRLSCSIIGIVFLAIGDPSPRAAVNPNPIREPTQEHRENINKNRPGIKRSTTQRPSGSFSRPSSFCWNNRNINAPLILVLFGCRSVRPACLAEEDIQPEGQQSSLNTPPRTNYQHKKVLYQACSLTRSSLNRMRESSRALCSIMVSCA